MSITTFLVRRSSLYGRRYLVYLVCFPFTFGGWRLSGAFEPVTTSQITVVVLSQPNRLIESLFGWNLSRFGFLSLFLSDSLPLGTQKMHTHTHTLTSVRVTKSTCFLVTDIFLFFSTVYFTVKTCQPADSTKHPHNAAATFEKLDQSPLHPAVSILPQCFLSPIRC